MPLGRGIDGLLRGRSIAAGDRYGRLLYRHQNQVGPVPSPIHHRLHGIGDKHHLTVNRNGRAQQNAGIRFNIRRVVRQDKVIRRLLTFGTNRFLRQDMRRRIGQLRIR